MSIEETNIKHIKSNYWVFLKILGQVSLFHELVLEIRKNFEILKRFEKNNVTVAHNFLYAKK